jgi:hypothetical protein
VAKGAAWAVPVITVGAAAPHAAASPRIVFDTAKFCKRPGSTREFAYALYYTSATQQVSAECITPGWQVTATLLANQCGTYAQIENPDGDSEEPQVDLTFVFVDENGVTSTVTALAPDHWNPCQSKGCG